ncbi:MAG TPA: glycosyltransferase [Candidatus Limnocylindria bacterium]|nr:glycosyltransferase [Candidatus Limnocylindria bacterium]
MRISTFLPHVGVFGGVRRFLELGNVWIGQGHDVTLFVPDGRAPDWLPYSGPVLPLAAATERSADLALCAETHTYDAFRSHQAARHVYYCVIEKDVGLGRAAADPEVILAANSSALRRSVARRTGRPVLDGAGGIHLGQFHPAPERRADAPLRVLVNGRRSRTKKGTDLILRALSRLPADVPPCEVVLFDAVEPHNRQDPRPGAPLPSRGPVQDARFVLNPSQAELVALYQSAHVYVAAERKAGWCNTALEAIACGAALVCTPSGTRDFARHRQTAWVVPIRHPFFLRRGIAHVLRDRAVRERLAAAGPGAAAPWSWERLAHRLLEQLAAT